MRCYCCSGLEYDICCQPFIQRLKNPPTAESLMRSRYTAFCLLDHAYLNLTVCGPAKRYISDTVRPCHWVKLDILNTVKGSEKDRSGSVQFNAFFKENNQRFCLTETSQFKKIDGLWFYVDGISNVESIAAN